MLERVWVSVPDLTEKVSRAAARDAIRKHDSHGDWDLARSRVMDNVKVRAGMARWRDGASWEDTGIYEFTMGLIERRGSHDGLRTVDDVVDRYRRLDEIWQQVRAEGRLRSMSELDPANVKEVGGISVGIARDGDVVWVSDGSHRLAMALSAGLDRLPARLVLVHPSGRRNHDVVWSRAQQPLRDLARARLAGIVGSVLSRPRTATARPR